MKNESKIREKIALTERRLKRTGVSPEKAYKEARRIAKEADRRLKKRDKK